MVPPLPVTAFTSPVPERVPASEIGLSEMKPSTARVPAVTVVVLVRNPMLTPVRVSVPVPILVSPPPPKSVPA